MLKVSAKYYYTSFLLEERLIRVQQRSSSSSSIFVETNHVLRLDHHRSSSFFDGKNGYSGALSAEAFPLLLQLSKRYETTKGERLIRLIEQYFIQNCNPASLALGSSRSSHVLLLQAYITVSVNNYLFVLLFSDSSLGPSSISNFISDYIICSPFSVLVLIG